MSISLNLTGTCTLNPFFIVFYDFPLNGRVKVDLVFSLYHPLWDEGEVLELTELGAGVDTSGVYYFEKKKIRHLDKLSNTMLRKGIFFLHYPTRMSNGTVD